MKGDLKVVNTKTTVDFMTSSPVKCDNLYIETFFLIFKYFFFLMEFTATEFFNFTLPKLLMSDKMFELI